MNTIDRILYENPEVAFCSCCQGTGRTAAATDELIGLSVRAIRRRYGLTAKDVALIMGLSFQYIGDLERGKRAWSLDLVKRYKKAVVDILETTRGRP